MSGSPQRGFFISSRVASSTIPVTGIWAKAWIHTASILISFIGCCYLPTERNKYNWRRMQPSTSISLNIFSLSHQDSWQENKAFLTCDYVNRPRDYHIAGRRSIEHCCLFFLLPQPRHKRCTALRSKTEQLDIDFLWWMSMLTALEYIYLNSKRSSSHLERKRNKWQSQQESRFGKHTGITPIYDNLLLKKDEFCLGTKYMLITWLVFSFFRINVRKKSGSPPGFGCVFFFFL